VKTVGPDTRVTIGVLRQMAAARFGDMVKAVIDVERGLMALDAELHADQEALLLDQGSRQADRGASTFTRTLRENFSSSSMR
jgi:hypothetical protein